MTRNTELCTVCGMEYVIEEDSGKQSFRADGKIIYEKSKGWTGWQSFRCHGCGECIHETVPGAEFGDGMKIQ